MRLLSPKNKFLLTLLLLISTMSQGKDYDIKLNWNYTPEQTKSNISDISQLVFDDSQTDPISNSLPMFVNFYPLLNHIDRVSIHLSNEKYIILTSAISLNKDERAMISNELIINHYIADTRKANNLHISMIPIRLNKRGEIEILVSATIQIETFGTSSLNKGSGFDFAEHSKLQSGDWYKVSITQDGIYKMDYNFLSGLGIDINNLDPNQINVYGNGGQMLPLENSIHRHDDIQLNSIYIHGAEDGSFDSNDYILFYGKGPHTWTLNSDNTAFTHEKHRFSSKAYYFIGIGIDPPKRIDTVTEVFTNTFTDVNTFNHYYFHEVNETNLNASGRELYGEHFDFQTEYSFSNSGFSFSNIDVLSPVSVKARVVNITVQPEVGEWELSCNNNSKYFTVNGRGTGSYHSKGVAKTVTIDPFLPTSDNLSVNISFQKDYAHEEAYLDYIEINARRALVMEGSQLSIRDANSIGPGIVQKFNLTNSGSLFKAWDVTDPINVKEIPLNGDGNDRSFMVHGDSLREFIVFKNSGYLSAQAVGQVENQDLHGLEQQDMIILAPPIFLSQAYELADYHREEGLLVSVVTPMQVYNEFSSGNQDITAIKSFCKMFYDRSTSEPNMLDYLLLFGDASYNNQNIDPLTSPLLLSYQNQNSLVPLQSFVTDDYFGFLGDYEGENSSDSAGITVDIGIGRFPINSVAEAQNAVQKIKSYTSNNTQAVNNSCFSNENSVFGDWRTKLVFVGDDEDGDLHIGSANITAVLIDTTYQEYNLTKIYLDAYQQETTPGGDRYPLAAKDLREKIEQGALVVSYFGHGGEVGWAHERIFDLPTINGFTNNNKLALFFTATCEFSRFDDPDRVSAGERLFLNQNGGAIALLSTSRPVYASGNLTLAKAFFAIAFEKDAETVSYGLSGLNTLSNGLRLGDITRITKNGIPSSNNKRSFTLLGDPALKIAYPKNVIEQDAILDEEGNPINHVSALQKVTITGHIEDTNGNILSDYNGFLRPVVYDKAKVQQTLQNDITSDPYSFKQQTSILYKGNASIENGVFSYTFIVPKDINYQQGEGKVSYYGLNDNSDAFGYNFNSESDQSFQISGQNENAEEDLVGPEISLFLNNENFIEGSITNENPILIAKFKDDHGINTSNSGIGHDLTLVIDDNTQSTIILSDLYQSDLDTYQTGSLRYALKDLPQGKHTLTIKAWDIYNNSSSKTISFEVANSSGLVLENVLNYPNPFTTHTEFMFQHNQTCSTLDVGIQVFTISGKLVKTLNNTIIPQHEGATEKVSWNGLDDYGDKLGRGVYVYKLKVKTPSGLSEEIFEKLVILN